MLSKISDLSQLPTDIRAEIHAGAKAEWPGDREMQEYYIASEVSGYLAFQAADFSAAEPAKDIILSRAFEDCDTWEYRAQFVEEEIAAFAELQNLVADDVPVEKILQFKQQAATEYDWYQHQISEVHRAIDGYRYIQRTRETIAPIRELLVRMEGIIGAECYNGNIQNYSSWGEWDGEGRSFRYPVTFIRNGAEEKRRSRTADLAHEELVTGYYKFGANELSVYRALVRIIDMLEAEYGFERPKAAQENDE